MFLDTVDSSEAAPVSRQISCRPRRFPGRSRLPAPGPGHQGTSRHHHHTSLLSGPQLLQTGSRLEFRWLENILG